MFKGMDYFDLESGFSSESRMIRDSVRNFVDKEFLPIVRDHYRAGGFPQHIIPMLGEMGLLGSNLKGYGLPGIDQISYGLVMQELERGDSGLRSFASVQGALVMYPIHTFGSEAQKERWLPPLGAGKAVGCFGLTEPDHGSDPAGMKTKAVKDGTLRPCGPRCGSNVPADVAVVAKLDGVRGSWSRRGRRAPPGSTGSPLGLRHPELIFDDVRSRRTSSPACRG
jgi:glutaryl-CoA dehydrogenase